ncbi:metallophosphoesterase [Frankia sp. AgKG'84/4]|uniref:metallophosphoesterase n=1 Tax=Frankia sp. AgKG'84/4 TaxID=573490 RepID=UPI00200E9218|nr:metallophosphoesterase [Frankia sp. AgKG'84/4]MCL9795902.1 metallophosphoesterase family protein [Frankia sp. AgKG'84/4]
MRYAVLADLHGRPKALRRVLAAAAEAGVDEVVVLGDYLEAKVPRRSHDPSRYWPLSAVVDSDPLLWSRLAGIRRVLGNQELRIRELLRPEQVPAGLAAVLDGPEAVRLHGLLGLHGHQIRWAVGGGAHGDEPGSPDVDDADHVDLLVPVPEDVPRVPVVVVGHTHQTAVFEIRWPHPNPQQQVSATSSPPPEEKRGPSVRVLPTGRGQPLRLPGVVTGGAAAPGDGQRTDVDLACDTTLLVNVAPARGRPHHWLLYDTERAEIDFREARPSRKEPG